MNDLPGLRAAPPWAAIHRGATPRVALRLAALALVTAAALVPAAPASSAPGGRAAARGAPSRPVHTPSAPLRPPQTTHVVPRGQPLARTGLRYRSGQYVELVAAQSVTFAVPAGEPVVLSLVGVPRDVAGPLPAGAPGGSVAFRAAGRTVAEVGLVTARAVPAASLGQRLGDYFSRPLTLALLGGLVACSLLLVILRRRATRRRRARVERRAGTEVA